MASISTDAEEESKKPGFSSALATLESVTAALSTATTDHNVTPTPFRSCSSKPSTSPPPPTAAAALIRTQMRRMLREAQPQVSILDSSENMVPHLVFVGTFAGGMSPYFMKWNEGFLVLGAQFAGGVFLGTALMHFLSDSDETFGDLTQKEYPFAFMLASVGYLLTMGADCIVSYVYGKASADHDVELQANSCDHATGNLNGLSADSKPHGNTIEGHFTKASLTSATSVGDSILLIAALCFHSVFEGIAIGVAETKADAWRALWTVCLHKIFAAVAMGIALLRIIPDRPLLSSAAYAFAFAISSPIGVAIGIIIDATTQGAVADWIYAISMGLACGVFIYVSINHLLSKGYKPQKRVEYDTPHCRFLAVLLGVAVIAVVMIWD